MTAAAVTVIILAVIVSALIKSYILGKFDI